MRLFRLALYPEEGTDLTCGLFVLSAGSVLAIVALSLVIWVGAPENPVLQLMVLLSIPWFARLYFLCRKWHNTKIAVG